MTHKCGHTTRLYGQEVEPVRGQTRTRVLLVLRLLGESYPRELARLTGASLNAVQTAVAGLERDGLVASRVAGRTRLVRLNPRCFALASLQPCLLELANADRPLASRIVQLRPRPRRTGKRPS